MALKAGLSPGSTTDPLYGLRDTFMSVFLSLKRVCCKRIDNSWEAVKQCLHGMVPNWRPAFWPEVFGTRKLEGLVRAVTEDAAGEAPPSVGAETCLPRCVFFVLFFNFLLSLLE